MSSVAQSEGEDFQIQCRMYENEFPAVRTEVRLNTQVDDLVMVKVTKLDAVCAYVQLLEYNNRDAIILLSELSRRRMKVRCWLTPVRAQTHPHWGAGGAAGAASRRDQGLHRSLEEDAHT